MANVSPEGVHAENPDTPMQGAQSMTAPIVIVGHRNPDNDSISAAVGYAYLKNELAKREAARSGKAPAEY